MKNKQNSRYDIRKTFEYNKEHGPFESIKNRNAEIKKILGPYGIKADFFGYKTKLPIGVAAGTLHNLGYMEGAMKDGFEVLTWKTFRSEHRLAHRNDGSYLGHNIVFLPTENITREQIGAERVATVKQIDEPEKISITNSVGMPSPSPHEWMPMLAKGQELADKYGKLVITSVVGTARKDDTIKDLARDCAFTALCAESVGERVIELNLSCPNVSGKEGAIYKDVRASKIIAQTVREHMRDKDTKILVKVGYADKTFYKKFIRSLSPYIDGIVAINTIPMAIVDRHGRQALPGGLKSGTCGSAILDLSVEAVSSLVSAKKEIGKSAKHIKIVGCGGVMNAEGFMRHIEAGAEFVMCATAGLFNPDLTLGVAQYIGEHRINIKI